MARIPQIEIVPWQDLSPDYYYELRLTPNRETGWQVPALYPYTFTHGPFAEAAAAELSIVSEDNAPAIPELSCELVSGLVEADASYILETADGRRYQVTNDSTAAEAEGDPFTLLILRCDPTGGDELVGSPDFPLAGRLFPPFKLHSANLPARVYGTAFGGGDWSLAFPGAQNHYTDRTIYLGTGARADYGPPAGNDYPAIGWTINFEGQGDLAGQTIATMGFQWNNVFFCSIGTETPGPIGGGYEIVAQEKQRGPGPANLYGEEPTNTVVNDSTGRVDLATLPDQWVGFAHYPHRPASRVAEVATVLDGWAIQLP